MEDILFVRMITSLCWITLFYRFITFHQIFAFHMLAFLRRSCMRWSFLKKHLIICLLSLRSLLSIYLRIWNFICYVPYRYGKWYAKFRKSIIIKKCWEVCWALAFIRVLQCIIRIIWKKDGLNPQKMLEWAGNFLNWLRYIIGQNEEYHSMQKN